MLHKLWLTVFLLLLLVLVGWNSGLRGSRQRGVFKTEPPSPYFHYLPSVVSHGTVLVVHGLDASKELMNLLCLALADSGFNVYSMDLPGHGDSEAGFNAIHALQTVDAVLNMLGPDTIVIGHSLGGTLLLDLANDRAFSTMVLLSPAPSAIEHVRAKRILVMTGQFDLPPILAHVQQLDSPQIEQRTIGWAGHSGYIMQARVINEIISWLGGDPSRPRTGHRLLFLLLEILGAVAVSWVWFRGKPIPAESIHIPTRILAYAASGLVALWISSVTALDPLRLFSTGYLIRFIFLIGILQLATCLRKIHLRFSKLLAGLLASAGVLTVVGLIGSPVVHLTLSDGRLWRFFAIAGACIPLCVAEEIFLRPIRPWWKSAGVAALTRILIAAFVIFGVLTMGHNEAFVVLIVHFIVFMWIGLWFAGELVRRNIQDACATGIFMALVQAWIFAAVFVLA